MTARCRQCGCRVPTRAIWTTYRSDWPARKANDYCWCANRCVCCLELGDGDCRCTNACHTTERTCA